MNLDLDVGDHLITGWHNYFGASDDASRESYRWALDSVHELLRDELVVDEVNEKIQDRPEVAWNLILKLVETAPTRASLIGVAVVPLRQLMHFYFEAFIDKVTETANSNIRFAYALSHVELWNESHQRILQRLARRSAILTFADEPESETTEAARQICETWFRFFRGERADDDIWAVTLVPELAALNPNQCWSIILSLLDSAESTGELSDIGCLVGDLLKFNPDFTARVQEKIETDWRFACALSDTYLPESIQPENLISAAREYKQKAHYSQFGLKS